MMKENRLPFKQIEWWLMTLLTFLIVLTNILGGKVDLYDLGRSDNSHLTTQYFAYIFIPLVLYAAFYFLHVKILPAYRKDGRKAKMILYALLTFFLSWFIVGIFYVQGQLGDDLFMPFFFIAMVLYLAYHLSVWFLNQLFLLTKTTNSSSYNVIRCLLLYVFMLIFLSNIKDFYHLFILVSYTAILPLLVVLLLYNYFLIFRMRVQEKPKAAKTYNLLLPISVLVASIVAATTGNNQLFVIGTVISLFILAVFNPLAQLLFTRYHNVLGKIGSLTTELDQKSADLQFLRSQINPHFLFNALNSLYGAALQENSEKTAEGIQKLGDMMRFMLHENNQDSIAVDREKEYLINYVDLQLLRTSGQENIEIIFNCTETHCSGEIAPMLLIPFVENAFKHGISLQKKSWVKISLRCMDGAVHLDINNSIHRSAGEDPEKRASGIGLPNVKQRLNLLYPDRHELVIRENELEYFVHLSIQLNTAHA